MNKIVDGFNGYRVKMNEVILSKNSLLTKRLCNLDTYTYNEGFFVKKTKEMPGLVTGMVLR